MGKIILEYNGKRYRLKPKDIPSLKGLGRIIINRRNGLQEQVIEGCFGNINSYQDDSGSYINGVNIEDLIKKLEAKQ
jgi:hypothetical protein